MTAHRALKKKVRARMARTGESYTSALRHVRSDEGVTVSEPITPSMPVPFSDPSEPTKRDRPTVRLAVAQTTQNTDPSDPEGFHAAGQEIRELMRRAAQQGADIVQFPEGALCFPATRRLSADPDRMAEADWSRFAWDALEDEISTIREAARQHGVVTVLGAQHRPTGPNARPTTSLLVIGADGRTIARYDERYLSRTTQDFMYAAGTSPATVEVRGVQFGLASGLEILFPEILSAYEADGCDAVLFSSAGPGEPEQAESLATSARASALQNGLAVGYAVPTSNAPHVPAGVVGPEGIWQAQCTGRERADLATAVVSSRTEGEPREWHRRMRSQI
jgi:predicted amidohydrolase